MNSWVNKIIFCLSMVVFSNCAYNITTTPTIREAAIETTLIAGGYGYKTGDIVLLNKNNEPQIGDIVQYEGIKNKSNCMSFGPGLYLAKVIGKPRDKVNFKENSFSANNLSGSFDYGEKIWPRTKPTMWGIKKYEDVANMQLEVPSEEYLADKWIGQECPGEIDENGSSIPYNRFTIKKEAITGVVLKKIGHDQKFAEEIKRIIY